MTPRAPTLLIAALLLVVPNARAQQAPPNPERTTWSDAVGSGPPMTADDAAARARASSPSMARARALRREAEASVGLARMGLFPRLEVEARYRHVDGFSDGAIETGAGTITFAVPRDQLTLDATVVWPVSDVLLSVLPAIEAAEAGVSATMQAEDATAATVALQGQEAYFTLARARAVAAVAQASLGAAKAQQRQVQAAVDAGMATQDDALAAEARVAAAERGLVVAQSSVTIANSSLRGLLGLDEGPPFDTREAFEAPGPVRVRSAKALVSTALANRPELAALEERLRSQQAASRAQGAAAYPHLAVFAGGTVARPNPLVVPPSSDFVPNWQIGASLTWSTHDLLTTIGQGDVLAAQRAATKAEIEQLTANVTLDVRRARERWLSARDAVTASDRELRAQEAALDARQASFRAGGATASEVFAASTAVDRARLQRMDALLAQRLAYLQLGHAIGGWPAHRKRGLK